MKVACPPPMVPQNKKGPHLEFCCQHLQIPELAQLSKLITCLLVGDLTNELVRHFLIETSAKGVRLKGCPNEPYFGECLSCRLSPTAGWYFTVFWLVGCLSALVYQHSMTPLALPCKLMIPTKGQVHLNPAQEDFDKDSFPLILPITGFCRPERGGAGAGHAH